MKLNLFIIYGLLFLAQSVSALDFYVAPDGDDANPGTKDKPFKSLVAARNAVRNVNKAMTGDISVYLRDGVYRTFHAVNFGPQDSGFNGHKVIYRALKDEKPVLSGGVALSNWTLYNEDKNIYRAKAPKIGFRQLYVDGKPAIRARKPNRDSETTFGPYWKPQIPKKIIYLTTKVWAAGKIAKRLNEVELSVISHWYHQRIRIGGSSKSGDHIAIKPVNPKGKFNKENGFYKHSFFFFENALAYLDAPNEWYYDPQAGVVYLALPKGIDPNTKRIEVPQTTTLVVMLGSISLPVHDIVFEGITFECSNWRSPSRKGINVTQFAQPNGEEHSWGNIDYPPGIIRAAQAKKIAFRNNTIRNTGAHGIQFFENVDYSDIEGNKIYNIAANGIEIDAHAERNPPDTKQSAGVAIWNNSISRCGRDYFSGGGIMAHNVRGLIVDHNHIYNMPYSGMQIGNQPGKMADIGCGSNKIRYNHIHHCTQLLDDGGGIYTLGGIQKNTVIAENYLHHIKRGEWAGDNGISMIYLDNFSSKILVKNNVIKGGKAEQRNRAKGNTFTGNTQSNAKVEGNAGFKSGYNPRKK